MTLTEAEYSPALIGDGYCLAEIPDFQALLPKSFEAGVPVFALTDEELKASGPVLAGLKEKRKVFHDLIADVVGKIEVLLTHA